ncbi:MAG: M48 family metallopeptidase [Patescibacteria group bacterium]|nr:M48 family metallopeptidase [Patescibacteria group bacterium]MCL5431626.1 M48 family metallopeptidase [Patescibacteria group bacterium]
MLSLINLYLLVIAVIVGLVYIRLQQAQFLGNALRVHEDQYPELFSIFKHHAQLLGIHRASLYIKQDPYPNAYTIGVTSCSVVLTSALAEQFSSRETSLTIGHELGHYKAGHTKISSVLIPLGTGNTFSNLIFGFWQRKTEYSADRCGLILTKDIDAAITSLLKLTVGSKFFEKISLPGYLTQMKSAGGASFKFSEMLVDHPLTTNRIRSLLLFWRENFKKA